MVEVWGRSNQLREARDVACIVVVLMMDLGGCHTRG